MSEFSYKNIILNSGNILTNNRFNNKMTYVFGASGGRSNSSGTNVDFKNAYVGLSSLQMYYSWYNISTRYGNNTLVYSWIDDDEYTIIIPDGNYSIETLNAYLQSEMISNGHYMVSSDGNSNIYFLELIANATTYKIDINFYPIPTAINNTEGWVLPDNAFWTVPSENKYPKLQITDGINTILGFETGMYPTEDYNGSSETITESSNSDNAPEVSPVSSIIVLCSLAHNPYSNPQTILYSFAPNSTFGKEINIQPPEIVYTDIREGQFSSIDIEFLDQDFQPIEILDKAITLQLSIKNKHRETL